MVNYGNLRSSSLSLLARTNMANSTSLWSTPDRTSWFLVPNSFVPRSGPLLIQNNTGGRTIEVDPLELGEFQITEAEALRWAREELGESLTELKENILAKLDEWRSQLDEFNHAPLTKKTKVTPEAGSLFYELLAALPKVFRESTSEDEARVGSARETMADLERRFEEAGLDVNGRVKAFPERLAKIARKSSQSDQNCPLNPPTNR